MFSRRSSKSSTRASYILVPVPPPINISKFTRHYTQALQNVASDTHTNIYIDTHDPALPLVVVASLNSDNASSSTSGIEVAASHLRTLVEQVRRHTIDARQRYEDFSRQRIAYSMDYYRRHGLLSSGNSYEGDLERDVRRYRAGETGSFSSGGSSGAGDDGYGY